MIPVPGTYSLTIDGAPVLSMGHPGAWATFSTLEEARFAARMLCGATVIRWRRTDNGNGRTSDFVERIRVEPVHGTLDLSAAPGRYLVPGATLAAFSALCEARGLRTSVAYRLSGPSLAVESRDGFRTYGLRVFDVPTWPAVFSVLQSTNA